MPLYEFKCKHCNHKFDKVTSYMESHDMRCPRCGGTTQKLVSCPTLITDTSFGMTGRVDKRFGPRPIEGRKDWDQRMKEKDYVELSVHDVKNQD